jgi:superfamily II DNA or RNA helicase
LFVGSGTRRRKTFNACQAVWRVSRNANPVPPKPLTGFLFSMAETILRPYQQKFVDRILQSLSKLRSIIACSATGSGKTKCFIYLAKRAMAKNFTVLILTEASKIYDQLTDELQAGNINSQRKDGAILPGHIYIAMAQTLARRPKMVQSFQQCGQQLLIINDEAHIGTATKLLIELTLNNPLLIGFTATPDFKFAKHLPEIYKGIVVGPQPDELVNDGYLSPYRHYARVLADFSGLKVKGGEYTEASQEMVFESKKVYDGLIKDLATQQFKKAIVFTASIKHCEDVFNRLTAAGFLAIRIHSKSPDCDYTMAQYRSADPTAPNICVSVGILTKGWDYPAVDLVILNRATTSLPLYLQMIGRGSRTSPGKDQFTVLDYGGNYERHGLWDAEIDWGKKWNQKPKKKKDGIAPIKLCPKCEYINPVSVSCCRNCGFIFPAPTIEPDDAETKLVELTAIFSTLRGKLLSQLSPHELAVYAKFKNKKAYAIRIAKRREQSNPGWIETFAKCMNYSSNWVWYQKKEMPTTLIEFHDQIIR